MTEALCAKLLSIPTVIRDPDYPIPSPKATRVWLSMWCKNRKWLISRGVDTAWNGMHGNNWLITDDNGHYVTTCCTDESVYAAFRQLAAGLPVTRSFGAQVLCILFEKSAHDASNTYVYDPNN